MDKVKIKIIEILGYIERLGYGVEDMYFGLHEVRLTLISKPSGSAKGKVCLNIYKSIAEVEFEDINLKSIK